MPSTSQMIDATFAATKKNPSFAGVDPCTALQFVYDWLDELKQRSPWHWQFVIRQVHGLISRTKEAIDC